MNNTQVYQMQDRAHPTALWRDWISFESGGMQIDLPSDTYTVLACLVDAGYAPPSFPSTTHCFGSVGHALLCFHPLPSFWKSDNRFSCFVGSVDLVSCTV